MTAEIENMTAEIAATTGTFSTVISYHGSAKYSDDETGLIYYGYRYCQPDAGRWVGRDPIEESGGANLYAFCLNTPVNEVDLLGLWRIERRGSSYAYAFPDAGDTIRSLSHKLRLNADEWTQWGRIESFLTRTVSLDTPLFSCEKVRIPNVVVVYTSKLYSFPHLESWWYWHPARVDRRKVITRAGDYAAKGYKAELRVDQDDGFVFAQLWRTEGIYAYLFAGHGFGGMYEAGPTWNVGGSAGISASNVIPPYKLGTIWALFCESTHSPSLTQSILWARHVSRTGGFRGYANVHHLGDPDYDINDPDFIP